jgi:class 3 adenylate cyclase
MLPRMIVDKLVKQTLETGSVEAFAQVYPKTSVLFIQVDVSRNCLDGEDLMAELNRIFSILDNLLNHHSSIFKVETVGAEYMAAAGVPDPCRSPVCALTSFAVHARSHLANVEWSTGVKVGVRMGIHSGSLVAGVAGKKSPRFRLFGDCVNTAARMKAIAKDGEIIASQDHVETMRG